MHWEKKNEMWLSGLVNWCSGTWGVCRNLWVSSRRTARSETPDAPPPDCLLDIFGLKKRNQSHLRRFFSPPCKTPQETNHKKPKPRGFSLSLRNSSMAFPSLRIKKKKKKSEPSLSSKRITSFNLTYRVSKASPLLNGCLCTSTMSGCSFIISSSSSLTLGLIHMQTF